MANRRGRDGWIAGLVAAAVVLMAVGLPALAQSPPAKGKGTRGKSAKGAAPQKKAPPNAADPLAGRAVEKEKEKEKDKAGTFHYKLKIQSDDVSLAASYYPGKTDTTTPVVLLVHEKDRSSKDFEDPIAELKGKSFAEHLQGLGYAVLSFDLRGHGANSRRSMGDREWQEMVDDLQSAYHFLLDRHNRAELNLAKLGVVALGEGANLTAAWAYLPGGAVSHEGRVTDLAGLVLISPLPSGSGFGFPTLMNSLAPRIPIMLLAGERDGPSHGVVKRVRATVEKPRQNRVDLFPSSLHGYKLLRLEPKATAVIERFLESTVKLKATEWEPRYNLSPVSYGDISIVRHTKPDDKAKAKGKDEAPKSKDDAKEKADEQPKEEKPKAAEKQDEAEGKNNAPK